MRGERSVTTILFTDIVGSTERAAELGDRVWRKLQAEHHARVRKELRRFGGREANTAGDAFLASATPAAGKTTFGLHVAHRMLSEGRVARVVVAAPTTHIARQWAADAARYGIDLEPNRPNADGPEPPDRRVGSRAVGYMGGYGPERRLGDGYRRERVPHCGRSDPTSSSHRHPTNAVAWPAGQAAMRVLRAWSV